MPVFIRLYYKIFLIYIAIAFFVFLGVYSVFSTDLFFDAKIKNIDYNSKNIYLDDNKLSNIIVVYNSKSDLSTYNISSICKIEYSYIGNKDSNYIFKINFLNDNNCKNGLLYLKNGDKIIKKSFLALRIYSKSNFFDLYADLNYKELEKMNSNLMSLISEKLKLLKTKTGIEKIKVKRKILELFYQKNLIQEIKKFRKQKYISPVLGYKISKDNNKLPNAGRPYRASYTDGIHHGWDVPAPLGTKVQALSFGKIIRIINNFKYSDLDKIRKYNLKKDDKVVNLDILRGNQVWLKTASGDVIFYSHLQNIPKNLRVGQIVYPGEVLGEVGISGVPDRSYKDYHLHFPIMKNPHLKSKVGKYTFLDIMKWDWEFKGKSTKYIKENQNNIFK